MLQLHTAALDAMRAARTLSRQSPRDRRLLVQSAALLSAATLVVWLLPFPLIDRWISRLAPVAAAGSRGGRADVDRALWALRVARRHVPRARCLAQAVAARVLLHRSGCPASIRIGVARRGTAGLSAHAWVEHDGRIVFGAPPRPLRFAVLPPDAGAAADDDRWLPFF